MAAAPQDPRGGGFPRFKGEMTVRDPIRALLGGLATVSLPLAGACAHEAGSDHAPEHAPIADWHLQPDYQLPGNAATDWPDRKSVV